MHVVGAVERHFVEDHGVVIQAHTTAVVAGDSAAEQQVLQFDVGGVAERDPPGDRGSQIGRAPDEDAFVGAGDRDSGCVRAGIDEDHVAGIEVVEAEHRLDGVHRRGRRQAVVAAAAGGGGVEVVERGAVVHVVDRAQATRRQAERVGAQVDLRAAGRQVAERQERLAVAADGEGQLLRLRVDGMDAPPVGVAGQLFGELGTGPQLGVEGVDIPGKTGNAIVRPRQVEPAAAGGKHRTGRGATGRRDATSRSRARACLRPTTVVSLAVDLPDARYILLPHDEQIAGVVRDGRRATVCEQVAHAAAAGRTGQLRPAAAGVLL